MTKRQYEDACAAAHALELIGERWALLVVRELMLGAKRFSDLRAGLPGISPNVLTQRLEDLERSNLLVRRKTPPPNSVAVYELTPWAAELEPVIGALGKWAARSPTKSDGAPMSVNGIVMSLRTMFNADASASFAARLNFALDGQAFTARVQDGDFEIERGDAENPDVAFEGGPNELMAIIYGGRSPTQMAKSGAIRLRGDAKVLARFAKFFPLPPKAPVTSCGD
jgi:DNA-binding HxlR family transcriptional regulator